MDVQLVTVSKTNDLSTALSELRALFPDWRMGQLIANLLLAAGHQDLSAIWEVEDEELLAAAQRLLERTATGQPARDRPK